MLGGIMMRAAEDLHGVLLFSPFFSAACVHSRDFLKEGAVPCRRYLPCLGRGRDHSSILYRSCVVQSGDENEERCDAARKTWANGEQSASMNRCDLTTVRRWVAATFRYRNLIGRFLFLFLQVAAVKHHP